MSKYAMYCSEGNSYVDSFINNVKRNNASYCVVYNQDYNENDFVITYNELVFEDFDDFLNQMDIGFVDPCNHRNNLQGIDDITQFFSQDKPDDWRQRD